MKGSYVLETVDTIFRGEYNSDIDNNAGNLGARGAFGVLSMVTHNYLGMFLSLFPASTFDAIGRELTCQIINMIWFVLITRTCFFVAPHIIREVMRIIRHYHSAADHALPHKGIDAAPPTTLALPPPTKAVNVGAEEAVAMKSAVLEEAEELERWYTVAELKQLIEQQIDDGGSAGPLPTKKRDLAVLLAELGGRAIL